MSQRTRYEKHLRGARYEHFEAQYFLPKAATRARADAHREWVRNHRRLDREIEAEELSDYEHAVRNYEFPYDPEFWDMLDWQMERNAVIEPRYWRL